MIKRDSMKTTIMLVLVAATQAFADSARPTMKAIVLHNYGGVDVLKYEEVARPEPGEDEVLIRVMAASVNPVDAAIRQGYLAKLTGTLPFVPGMDAAGVIEKVGSKITKFKTGDPVYAFFTLKDEGGYAEFVVARKDEVALKPKRLSYEEAASVPAAASTAWKALVETGKLGPGQTVLIHGGAGGVGHFAIQIARARGAKVIATASTANQDFLKQLGANVTIDYTKTKFEDVARDVDVVLDSVGEDTLKRSYAVVKKGGIIVSIVDDPDPAALEGRGIRGQSLRTAPDPAVLEELAKLIDAKKMTPVVSQVFPLSDVAKAHDQIATRHTRGKIVIKIAENPRKAD
ncbi:MAG: hypothetical protein QOH39_3590 [Verrucomicrobiota bacterium]